MTTIFKTKKDIAEFLKQSPMVAEAKRDFEEGEEPGAFDLVEDELVSLIAGAKEAPDFGEDWTTWLEDNLDELIDEAISILM